MGFFQKALDVVKDIGRTVVNVVASPVTSIIGKGPAIAADKFENDKFGEVVAKATKITGPIVTAALAGVGVGVATGVIGKGLLNVKTSKGVEPASADPTIIAASTAQVVKEGGPQAPLMKLLPGVMTPKSPLEGGAPKATGAISSLVTGIFAQNNPIEMLAPMLANSPAINQGNAIGIAQDNNPILSPFQVIGENLANDGSLQSLTGAQRSSNAEIAPEVLKASVPMGIVSQSWFWPAMIGVGLLLFTGMGRRNN